MAKDPTKPKRAYTKKAKPAAIAASVVEKREAENPAPAKKGQPTCPACGQARNRHTPNCPHCGAQQVTY